MKLLVVQRKSLVASGIAFSRSVYSRLLEPFDYLKEKKMIDYQVISEDDCVLEDMNKMKFDVVIFSKHVSEVSLKISEKSKSLQKKIIYDIDDNLLVNFPEYSGGNITDQRKENFYKHMQLADIVTVATKRLEKTLTSNLNREMIFIGNGFNVERHRNKNPRVNSKKKIIYTNADKIKLRFFYDRFFQAINKFLEKNLEVELEIFSDYESELKQFQRYHYLGSVDWFEHKKRLAEGNYLIGIVPLGGQEDPKELEFNSCKSPIKYLEYGGLEIAGIYSRSPIYTDVIEDRFNGILVENTEYEWNKALEEMLNNNELRNKIIKNAYEDVMQNHHVSKVAEKWMDVFRN